MKLQMTESYCNQEIYEAKENDPRYQDALNRFREVVETGTHNQIIDEVTHLETIVADIVYVKGFNDGIRLALSALAGKDIAEISYD